MTAATNSSPARTARSAVVLVRLGITEVDENAVAHVFRDEAAEALHSICDALLVGRDKLAQVLRVHSG